jgi:hypothetical protein
MCKGTAVTLRYYPWPLPFSSFPIIHHPIIRVYSLHTKLLRASLDILQKKQEVLGRTHLLILDTTWTAYKTTCPTILLLFSVYLSPHVYMFTEPLTSSHIRHTDLQEGFLTFRWAQVEWCKTNFKDWFRHLKFDVGGSHIYRHDGDLIKKLNSVALVCERTIPTERPPLFCEISANFADRGCHAVSVVDP